MMRKLSALQDIHNRYRTIWSMADSSRRTRKINGVRRDFIQEGQEIIDQLDVELLASIQMAKEIKLQRKEAEAKEAAEKAAASAATVVTVAPAPIQVMSSNPVSRKTQPQTPSFNKAPPPKQQMSSNKKREYGGEFGYQSKMSAAEKAAAAADRKEAREEQLNEEIA